MSEGVSIIICCYNSGWIIERCLNAIINQQVNGELRWEVVVVNNASTDNTKILAENLLKVSSVDYQIVDEIEPGLINARKKGANVANYSILIFCDDDNILCDTYIQTAYEIMSTRLEVGALGGKGIAEFQATPDPFVKSHLGGYAIGSQRNHAGFFVWGAGACIKTELVKKIFNTHSFYLTGRKGDILLAGEDSELILSIRLSGYVSASDDRLEYIHVLQSRRLTKEYFYKMWEGFAMAYPIINIYNCVLKKRSFLFMYLYYLRSLYKYIVKIMAKPSEEVLFQRAFAFNSMRAYHHWTFFGLHKIYKDLKAQ